MEHGIAGAEKVGWQLLREIFGFATGCSYLLGIAGSASSFCKQSRTGVHSRHHRRRILRTEILCKLSSLLIISVFSLTAILIQHSPTSIVENGLPQLGDVYHPSCDCILIGWVALFSLSIHHRTVFYSIWACWLV